MGATTSGVTRRSVLAAGGVAALAPVGLAGDAQRAKALRVGFLTDVHVQPERQAEKGLATCLGHVQSQGRAPELIVNGGDAIMDAFGADRARTKTQFEIWRRTLKSECSLPVFSAIGNHDVWGWGTDLSGSEEGYGKAWAVDALELPHRYFSKDVGNWHFISLDSTRRAGRGYTAHLDDEQLAWLEADLAGTSKPTCLVSHISIVTATGFAYAEHAKRGGDLKMPGSWAHTDAPQLIELFRKHPHVKLCLSGHMHHVDRVDYHGVSYICGGAVSGGWWDGDYYGFGPAYVMLDLHDDGKVESETVFWGWEARE